ncbi:MAG: hypothetical protein HKL80_07435 [Acidimicrobiales bacterium]|nr:hypothetical protein [Acidimicrobiales bacterium]
MSKQDYQVLEKYATQPIPHDDAYFETDIVGVLNIVELDISWVNAIEALPKPVESISKIDSAYEPLSPVLTSLETLKTQIEAFKSNPTLTNALLSNSSVGKQTAQLILVSIN